MPTAKVCPVEANGSLAEGKVAGNLDYAVKLVSDQVQPDD